MSGICTFNTFGGLEGIFFCFLSFEAREDSLKKASLEISNQSDKLTRKKLEIRKGIFTPSRIEEEKKTRRSQSRTLLYQWHILRVKRTKIQINSGFCSLSNHPNRWFRSAPFGFLFAFGIIVTRTSTQTHTHTTFSVDSAYNKNHRWFDDGIANCFESCQRVF